MPKFIDEDVLQALQALIERRGNPKQAAEFLEIDRSMLHRWLSGQGANSISLKSWLKIKDKLEPYMKKKAPHLKPHLSGSYVEAQRPRDEAVPIKPRMNTRPVVGLAQAMTWDALAIPFEDFARDNGEVATVPVEWDGESYVFKVDGESMLPYYVPGTLVLADLRMTPQHGMAVVAKLRTDGSVVIKLFARTEDGFELRPFKDQPGKILSFQGSLASNLEWIGVVKNSHRDDLAIYNQLKAEGKLPV